MPLQIVRTDRQLIDGLRDSDPSAVEELISGYAERLKRFLRRRDIAEAEAAALGRDILQAIVHSVRANLVQDPAALPGLVWTVARRRVALYLAEALRKRKAEAAEIARAVLAGMPERDREVLMRFYLGEQPAERICESLRITPNQLRLVKSQARVQFCELRNCVGRAPGIPLEAQKHVA